MSQPASDERTGLERFQALWRRCLLQGAPDRSAEIHRRLVDGYRETQRYYHTLEHIEHCLRMFDACRDLLQAPDAVELAVWFHDLVFEPGQPDNELRSAELYRDLARGVQDQALIDHVYGLVMATLHNGFALDGIDVEYIVDIDLSSFGLDWEEFLHDSENLRRENPHLEDSAYYRNQGYFQARLLERPRFFLSDFFYQRYEERARTNLARYFEYLEQRN